MRVVRFLQGCTYWQLPREEWDSQFTGTRHSSLQIFCPLALQRQTYGLLLSEDSQTNPRGIKHRCSSRITRLCLEDLESLSLRNSAGRAFNIARYPDVPFSDLIALYILADALQVHNLKDPIVTRIIDVYGFSGSTEMDSNDDKEEGKEQEGHEEGEEEEKASQPSK